jgi:hypothetical protein
MHVPVKPALEGKIFMTRIRTDCDSLTLMLLQQNLPIADSCSAASSFFIRSPRRRARG